MKDGRKGGRKITHIDVVQKSWQEETESLILIWGHGGSTFEFGLKYPSVAPKDKTQDEELQIEGKVQNAKKHGYKELEDQ